MAWAVTSAPAPTFDSGMTVLPASTTDVPSLTTPTTVVYLLGLHFCNANAVPVTVSVTDNAGGKLIDLLEIGGNSFLHLPFGLPPLTGLKWFASTASGVTGKAWGYQ